MQPFSSVRLTYLSFKSHWINMWLDLWVGPLSCASHGCDSVIWLSGWGGGFPGSAANWEWSAGGFVLRLGLLVCLVCKTACTTSELCPGDLILYLKRLVHLGFPVQVIRRACNALLSYWRALPRKTARLVVELLSLLEKSSTTKLHPQPFAF